MSITLWKKQQGEKFETRISKSLWDVNCCLMLSIQKWISLSILGVNNKVCCNFFFWERVLWNSKTMLMKTVE